MTRIHRQTPTHSASHYDPNAHRVMLAPDATPYAVAHETAHRAQQAMETAAWHAHRAMMHTPYLCRVTRIWLEWEAARWALRAMRERGTWTLAARTEARRELWGYLTCLVR